MRAVGQAVLLTGRVVALQAAPAATAAPAVRSVSAVPVASAPGAAHTVRVGRPGGQVGQPAMDRHADLDADGHADMLLNDPYYQEPVGGERQHRGRLWLVRGGPAGPRIVDDEAAASWTFLADTRVPGMFGYTWNTGDFDGDGRTDIVVGDHYAGDHALREHVGRVYLFRNGGAFTARARP